MVTNVDAEFFFRMPRTVSFTRYECAECVVLAGRETVVETVPTEHGTVTGSPEMTETLEEKVQLTAFATVADKVAGPPAELTGEGVEVKPEMVGAVFTGETVISVVVLTFVLEPTAVIVTVYVPTRRLWLAPTVTFADAEPDPQGTVTGSPETARMALPWAEKVHDVAFATVARSVTGPPVHDTGDGLAL